MFHIGVDIGGTFTDCVLVGDSTEGIVTYSTAKTLSTKADPAEGVLAGLAEPGANAGLARPELLARTGRFVSAARKAPTSPAYVTLIDPAPDMVLAG